MVIAKDLKGKKFGKLTVIERSENINKLVAWKCVCECGKETIVRAGDLTKGGTQSCGRCKDVFDKVFYKFIDNYVKVHVKNGKTFLIDEEDLDKIKDYGVSVDPSGYVTLYKNSKRFNLARFLMNPDKNQVVDHINRKPYDNRKSNLRVCYQYENTWNTSKLEKNKTGVIGVHFHKSSNMYRAIITVKGKDIYLGKFKNLEDAAKARKEAEQKYFGEFAPN